MKATTYAPFAKPLYVMVKPVGAVCNLACEYCYYLEKANLYKENPKHVMSDELLEKFIDCKRHTPADVRLTIVSRRMGPYSQTNGASSSVKTTGW